MPEPSVPLNLDWISFRAAQSFPLADDASGVSISGVQLPPSLLLDLRLNLPPQTGEDISNDFYLKRVRDDGNVLAFIFGFRDIECAACYNVPKTLGMPQGIGDRYFLIYPLTLPAETLAQYPFLAKLTGNLIAGAVENYHEGTLEFTLENGRINSMCIEYFSVDTGLEAFKVNNQTLIGEVSIQAGPGITVSVDMDSNSIVFNLDEDYIKKLIQDKTLADYGQPVMMINERKPDQRGNIQIVGSDNCIEVESLGPGTIAISNKCALPCCQKQPESEFAARIQVLTDAQKILNNYFVNMMNNINFMQVNLAAVAFR